MGNKLIKAFEPWLNENVTIPAIKTLAIKVLESADDSNAENPASSSGKYHPTSDMGPGGNVRHSILVAEITKVIMRAYEMFDDKRFYEATAVAGLLHDICKYKSEDASHTQFDHPVAAAKLIREIGKRLGQENGKDGVFEGLANMIAEDVETHMGRWNTSKYYDGALPLPENLPQKVVHIADLVSANKELPITMDKFTKEAEEELKANE